jgi:hypothetical protein
VLLYITKLATSPTTLTENTETGALKNAKCKKSELESVNKAMHKAAITQILAKYTQRLL